MPNTNNENKNQIDDDLDLGLQHSQVNNDDLDDDELEQESDIDNDPELQSNQSDEFDSVDNELSEDLDKKENELNNQEQQKESDPVRYLPRLDKLSNRGKLSNGADENVTIAKSKVVLIKRLLANVKENNNRLIQLLSGLVSDEDEASISIGQLADEKFNSSEAETDEGRIIEGVFDGENMIGPDGKQYSIPVNYASKSKLVEGDILKLTITANGTFIYKQIGPIERSRVVGKLERNSDGNYVAIADNKKWRILTASVTYFKGEHGDEIVILIPKTGESKWAAVENIVRDANSHKF